MKEKKSSESRRKLLKSIAAGSGAIVAGKSLPESWKRPVVDSVMLPAHAQTSPPSTTFSCSVVGQATINVSGGEVAGPIEYVVTNTGTGPLTGGDWNTSRAGGNTSFNTDGPGGILDPMPDPFNPGENFIVEMTDIDLQFCSEPGTITVEFTSNESTCQQVVDVTCGT